MGGWYTSGGGGGGGAVWGGGGAAWVAGAAVVGATLGRVEVDVVELEVVDVVDVAWRRVVDVTAEDRTRVLELDPHDATSAAARRTAPTLRARRLSIRQVAFIGNKVDDNRPPIGEVTCPP